jgi:hypothetical protein
MIQQPCEMRSVSFLKGSGLTVEVAVDGKDGLTKLKK